MLCVARSLDTWPRPPFNLTSFYYFLKTGFRQVLWFITTLQTLWIFLENFQENDYTLTSSYDRLSRDCDDSTENVETCYVPISAHYNHVKSHMIVESGQHSRASTFVTVHRMNRSKFDSDISQTSIIRNMFLKPFSTGPFECGVVGGGGGEGRRAWREHRDITKDTLLLSKRFQIICS